MEVLLHIINEWMDVWTLTWPLFAKNLHFVLSCVFSLLEVESPSQSFAFCSLQLFCFSGF